MSNSKLSIQKKYLIDEFLRVCLPDPYDFNWIKSIQLMLFKLLAHSTFDYEEDIMTFSILFYKLYTKSSLPKITISNFILANVQDEEKVNRIKNIMKYIPLSTQESSEHIPDLSVSDFQYLSLLRDAVRIRRISPAGLSHCIEYVTKTGGSVPRDVVKYCKEKLLNIYPKFITSEMSLKIGKEYHDNLLEYVEKYSKDSHMENCIII